MVAPRERIWIEGWHQQRGDREAVAPDEESGFKASLKMNGKDTNMAAVLPDKTYPAAWQAWRIGVHESAVVAPFELTAACRLSGDVQLSFQTYFIPAG